MTKKVVDLNQTEPALKKTRKNDDVWRIAKAVGEDRDDISLILVEGEFHGKEPARHFASKPGNLGDGTYHLVRMSPPFTVKTERKEVTKIEF